MIDFAGMMIVFLFFLIFPILIAATCGLCREFGPWPLYVLAALTFPIWLPFAALCWLADAIGLSGSYTSGD